MLKIKNIILIYFLLKNTFIKLLYYKTHIKNCILSNNTKLWIELRNIC